MEFPADGKGNGPAVFQSFAAGDVVLSSEPWVCSFKYQSYKRKCAYCFTEFQKLMKCSRCELHYYCGRDCQALDWKKNHKHECKMLNEMNINIRQLDPRVEETYKGEFGFCTAEILMAKIVNMIQMNRKEQFVDLTRELAARDALEMLPYDPHYEKRFNMSDPTLHSRIWPTATLGSIPLGFSQLARKVYYNAFPMLDQAEKEMLVGAGLFPRALHRQMTPVCLDINVTMDLQRRTLVARATEDIISYRGTKDLRQNERSVNIFATTVQERRLPVRNCYLDPCDCNKCTEEYDARINPLKCVTTKCTERIPSDLRAVQPCSQCGALNDQRLRQLKVFMERNGALERDLKVMEAVAPLQLSLLLELDQANLLHVDSHFRYILGNSAMRFLWNEQRYEEAWKLCPGMVACVRAIFPKYHLGRACFLRRAGEIACLWYGQAGTEAMRAQWKTILDAKILGWLCEARDIYHMVAGPANPMESHLAGTLRRIGQITKEVAVSYPTAMNLSGLLEYGQFMLRHEGIR